MKTTIKKTIKKIHIIITTIATSIISTFASADFTLESPATVSAGNEILQFLQQTNSLLPNKVKQSLDKKFVINFVKFDSETVLPPPRSFLEAEVSGSPLREPLTAPPVTSMPSMPSMPSSHILGEVDCTKAIISLNSNFIPHISHISPISSLSSFSPFSPILQFPIVPEFPFKHKNFYRTALATLLHEIAHCYYQKEKKNFTKIEKEQFYSLTGWYKTGAIARQRYQHNLQNDRSPDPYEYKNAEESFAINFEYFLLDPEFKCRRPTLYRWFSMALRERASGEEPFKEYPCKIPTEITIPSTFSLNSIPAASPRIHLDPARVYQIHYLLAGEGDATGSFAGHSMFRIIVCPENMVPGPECLHNIKEHVVASFAAEVPTPMISAWSGLNGDYKSGLYFMSLEDVYLQYAVLEKRPLKSIPLQLTSKEQESLIYRLLEIKASYSGSYYFLSNNCAVESLNLLKSSVNNQHLIEAAIITPKGLYDLLKESGIMDDSILQDHERAITEGYYFPSSTEKLDQIFRAMMREGQTEGQTNRQSGSSETLSKYLASNAQERHNFYQQRMHAKPIPSLDFTARFLTLEKHIFEQKQKELVEKTVFQYVQYKSRNFQKLAPHKQIFYKSMEELFELLKVLREPRRLQYGYGLPLI
ncbi:MAG: DUF4105 domain-containing protein [Oligoflexia bacterium]|nr:DUF4105 domain-containing protein [Oligoflexia bacterium]